MRKLINPGVGNEPLLDISAMYITIVSESCKRFGLMFRETFSDSFTAEILCLQYNDVDFQSDGAVMFLQKCCGQPFKARELSI